MTSSRSSTSGTSLQQAALDLVDANRQKFPYLNAFAGCLLATTLYSLDTLHSIVFIFCKYRQGE